MGSTIAIVLSCQLLVPPSLTGQAVCGPPAGRRIAVSPRVSLQVVDWGGTGETILFLSGAAMPASVFDDFAPLFTDAYHVMGVTRRGAAPSDLSNSGYGAALLVHDLLAVMDSLAIPSAHIIGWSFGGIEAVWLAVARPDRVKSLVLLDSYDLSAEAGHFPPLGISEPAPPPMTPFDSTSALAIAWRQRRLGQAPLPLAAICAFNRFSADGRFQGRARPFPLIDSLVRGLTPLPHRQLTQPVLALFAVARGVGDLYPSYATMGPDDRWLADSLTSATIRGSAAARAHVRREVPHLTVTEIPGAAHALFLSHSGIAYQAIMRFLSRATASHSPPAR